MRIRGGTNLRKARFGGFNGRLQRVVVARSSCSRRGTSGVGVGRWPRGGSADDGPRRRLENGVQGVRRLGGEREEI